MIQKEKLSDLGFEETTYAATKEKCLKKYVSGGRFTHEFCFFDDGELIINAAKSNGWRTVSVDEILENHNDMHEEAKELMQKLLEFGYGKEK